MRERDEGEEGEGGVAHWIVKGYALLQKTRNDDILSPGGRVAGSSQKHCNTHLSQFIGWGTGGVVSP